MTMNNISMWTCPQCGRTNSGRFCVICGAKRPKAEPVPVKEAKENEPFEIPEIDAMISDSVEETVNEAVNAEEAKNEEIKEEIKDEVKEEIKEEIAEEAAAVTAAAADEGASEFRQVYEVPEVMVPSDAAEKELARREKEKLVFALKSGFFY